MSGDFTHTKLFWVEFIEENIKFTGHIIDCIGNNVWIVNGLRHRTDGPAVITANGSKFWHLNGKYHRTDGPAVEFADGTKYWYLNGLKHRTEGPAIEWANGDKFWYLNGDNLTEEDWTYTVRLNKLGEFLNGSN